MERGGEGEGEGGGRELDLNLSLQSSSPPEPPGFFSCTYCDKKFYSSQALGGHQNGHKFERSVAKRTRELAAAARRHAAPDANATTPPWQADEEARKLKGVTANAPEPRARESTAGSSHRLLPEERDRDLTDEIDLSLKL